VSRRGRHNPGHDVVESRFIRSVLCHRPNPHAPHPNQKKKTRLPKGQGLTPDG